MYRTRATGFFPECVGSDLIGSYFHTIFFSVLFFANMWISTKQKCSAIVSTSGLRVRSIRTVYHPVFL